MIPLLITVLTVVGGAQYIMGKKLRAQVLCVREVTALQSGLRRHLNELTQLNPEARRLRVRRRQADERLTRAIASANPYAVALAQAAHTAVVLQQMNLRARQEVILAEAENTRRQHERGLRHEARALTRATVNSQHGHSRALAVRATPAQSLTPDYVPEENFALRQEHTYSFDVPLSPDFLRQSFHQQTKCSATLTGKERLWQIQLKEASALSKRP